tara:strand:+ start:128 stop:724 length:597 start_codon:yes stop_codon:yes gene_type:complete
MKQDSNEEEKDELMQSISNAIVTIQREKEASKIKSLSRHNPEKVAKILYLHALGCSQTNMIRRHNISRTTVVAVLADYADHTNSFRELGGQLAARSYINLESLEEDMIDALRVKMDGGYEPEFRDLKEISIAKANSQRQAMTARGEASQVVDVNNTYTMEDFQETLVAARKRIQKIKDGAIEAQVIEEEDPDGGGDPS